MQILHSRSLNKKLYAKTALILPTTISVDLYLKCHRSVLLLQSEERCLVLSRENGDLQSRIDDGEDEMEEIIRNNKQLITQVH